jgi:hypothetical protein
VIADHIVWTARLGLISCTFMLWCSVLGLNVSEGCCRSCSPRHQVIALLHVRSRHQVIALLQVRSRSQADVQRIPETVHRHLAHLIRYFFRISNLGCSGLVYIILVASTSLVKLPPKTLSHMSAVSIYGRVLLVAGRRPHRDDQFGIGESCM